MMWVWLLVAWCLVGLVVALGLGWLVRNNHS